ncbi:MAG: hypothetical protein HFF58_03350 [Lawsonibacter sp.]|nr:hypothetical protein [Lawsonibacter sp.]
MFACKVMIKSSMEAVKARFQDYEGLEFFQRGDWVLAEDFSGTQLFGWEVSTWLELAGKDELIYAYYDENMNAEFVFIQNGLCMRAYQEYDGEVDTDQGEDLDVSISGWSDVAEYMDEHMV